MVRLIYFISKNLLFIKFFIMSPGAKRHSPHNLRYASGQNKEIV